MDHIMFMLWLGFALLVLQITLLNKATQSQLTSSVSRTVTGGQYRMVTRHYKHKGRAVED